MQTCRPATCTSWHSDSQPERRAIIGACIPFENLDPHRGIPVSLAEEDLERKLVRERRGGYCFEQNLLLASALEHLGLEVEPMLARVRAGAPPGTVRPRSHLVLRVTDGDGRVWHADVGFGSGTLLDPIPFGPDRAAAHEQSGWSFRVVEEGPELVLQTLSDGTWSDGYAFPRSLSRASTSRRATGGRPPIRSRPSCSA
jgi:N-hydroxyarylamine O-acetyltransferase